MLFNKTICPKCKATFDECLEKCPICNHQNNARDIKLAKQGPVWLRWELQLMLALVGSIGFILLTILVGMFVNPISDMTLKLMLGNSIAYLILTIILVTSLILNRKFLSKSLKDYFSIFYGVIFGGLLIGLSIALEGLLGLFHETTPGGNQGAIIEMVKNYPVVTFFVICILGPVCEEITYRIGLFTLLRRINRPVAYILTILIFTAIHLDYTSSDFVNELWNLPGYLLGATILTVAYDLKGPYTSTMCHIVNNLVSFISILIAVNS